MAAYYYVASKQDLLDLVAARALADIVPEPSDLPWPRQLRAVIDQIDEALRRHRGVGEVLLDRMHRTEQHVMRAVMQILSGAGFGDAEVVLAYALIHTYLFGRYREAMAPPPPAVDAATTEDDDIVSRAGPLSAELHGRDYYNFGVDTLIKGLEAQLGATKVSAPGSTSSRRRHDRQH